MVFFGDTISMIFNKICSARTWCFRVTQNCFVIWNIYLYIHRHSYTYKYTIHILDIYSSLSILSHWDFDHWDLKHLCDILSFLVYLFYLTKFLKLKLYSLFYMLASATPLSNSVHPKIINELYILGEKCFAHLFYPC